VPTHPRVSAFYDISVRRLVGLPLASFKYFLAKAFLPLASSCRLSAPMSLPDLGYLNANYRNLISRYSTIDKLWVRFGKFLLRLIGEIY